MAGSHMNPGDDDASVYAGKLLCNVRLGLSGQECRRERLIQVGKYEGTWVLKVLRQYEARATTTNNDDKFGITDPYNGHTRLAGLADRQTVRPVKDNLLVLLVCKTLRAT